MFSFNVYGQTGLSASSREIKPLQCDEQAIMELLINYKHSIDKADVELAKSFWLNSEKVSFINPKDHVKGWQAIESKVYGMFASKFSTRKLSTFDETISVYGDMAVLEFYWVFDATSSDTNPKTIQTKGRETQVVKKFDDGWKLVHVHYSNMPETK